MLFGKIKISRGLDILSAGQLSLEIVSPFNAKLFVSKSSDQDLQSHWGQSTSRLGFPRAHLSRDFIG